MHTAFLARDAPSQPTCDGGHPNRWSRETPRRSLAAPRVFWRLHARAGRVRDRDAALSSDMLHLASSDRTTADEEELDLKSALEKNAPYPMEAFAFVRDVF